MTLLIIVLVAGVAMAVVSASRGTPRPAASGRSARAAPSLWWLLAAVLVGLLFLRFGMHWLAVVGGVLLAATRTIVPLLRFLPLLSGFRRSAASRGAGAGAAAGSGPSGHAPGKDGRKPPSMTRQEALQVLGLDAAATKDDVRREYRRLMKKIHPDLGGSSYLAAKINEAKDVLL